MKDTSKHYLSLLLEKHHQLKVNEGTIIEAFEQISDTFAAGGKLLVCGNGGSAADADHIVGELMKGFLSKRTLDVDTASRITQIDTSGELVEKLQMALPAINLAAHNSLVTAICNDTSSDLIYAQQVLGYGKKGDILLGISTSGNSANIINAGIVAKALSMKTIGLTGANRGKMDDLFGLVIKVPESATANIQELHLPIYHTLCAMLEEEFFGKDDKE